MDIIYNLALDAETRFRRLGKTNTPSHWKNFIEETLYDNINKNADKRRFLLTFNRLIQENLEGHKAKCSKINCQTETDLHSILFSIEQVLDSIPENIDPPIDSFSTNEQINITIKLDDILKQMKESDSINNAAFEVLYNEIQELKGLMNLGKKNWKQLGIGKVSEMVLGGIVDKAFGNQIFNAISETKSEFLNLLT